METAANTLNDVIVVGYSSQRKASITGAVSTVDMKDITKTRIADVAQALQGQVQVYLLQLIPVHPAMVLKFV